MDVQLTPEMQAKLDHLSVETGRSQAEFIREALAGYLDDLSLLRETIDSRYEDIVSGKIRMIPEAEVLEVLRTQSAAIKAAEHISSS